MTGRYKAYPEYKESGVEWLGKVPQGWSIHSLKRSVDGVTNGIWGSEPDNESDLIVLRVADFNRDQLNISDDKLTFRSIDPKDRASRLLKKGDLLIEKSGGGDKTLVGCVVLFDKDYPAVTSNFVAKMTPQEGFDSSFLRYAFSQLYAGKVNFPSIKQTTGIQNLDSDAYLLESFVFPSFTEQQKIASFLDHETAKIDTLIAKQEKLIELLKEKRQAVISHAVTKGLNPNAPMCDSGVEWLGEVPEHWVHSTLKHYSNVIDCKHITAEFFDSGIPLASIGEVKGWFVDLISAKYTNEKYYKELIGGGRKPQVGDIIYSRNATVGEAAIVRTGLAPFAMGQDVCLIKLYEELLPEFAMYVFHSGVISQQLELAMVGSTFKRINVDNIRNFAFAIPPYQEQELIVKELEKLTSKYDKLVLNATNAIHLMKERKTALISAAVTGKIDVRDFAVEEN
ncbi:restriction endonuclease subunit S [Pseudoalteromonas neustonica]|uniref:Restriction endonuclease subunit S n=1 Tax=Pseudoalteromonas neustonica TaxID=1840331 RepID=A0ABU9U4R9_9GAMM